MLLPHLRRQGEDRSDVDLVRLFSLHLLLKLLEVGEALVPGRDLWVEVSEKESRQ